MNPKLITPHSIPLVYEVEAPVGRKLINEEKTYELLRVSQKHLGCGICWHLKADTVQRILKEAQQPAAAVWHIQGPLLILCLQNCCYLYLFLCHLKLGPGRRKDAKRQLHLRVAASVSLSLPQGSVTDSQTGGGEKMPLG